MKKLLTSALLATSLAVSASAATIVGFEAGYLTDSKDAYLSTRIGYEIKADTSLSHQLEIELGYSKSTDSGVDFKVMPLTFNYRAEFIGGRKLGYYLGGGVGVSRNSIRFPGSGVPWISDSDTALALQAFTGINFKVSPTTTLNLGVKYLWIGEASLVGITDDVGDDLAVMAGVSFRF